MECAHFWEKDPRICKLSVLVPKDEIASFKGKINLTLEALPKRDYLFGYPKLKKRISEIRPDIVFIPTARWINVGGIPITAMVRNMEPLVVPFQFKYFLESVKNLVRAYWTRKACLRANSIITVSKHVQNYVLNIYSVSESKTARIYEGIRELGSVEATQKPESISDSISFLFTAGSLRPYRGLEDAVKALALLQSISPDIYLAIAGKPDNGTKGYVKEIKRLSKKHDIDNRVIWLGHLNSKEMKWCYEKCRAFLMTSRVEACPNTALEAMSHLCEIVSTNTPPMPEVFADAALYYSAGDYRALATRIESVLRTTDQDLQRRRAAASRRARDFSWETTASSIIDVLVKTVDKYSD